jgi:head-tail adaptor
VVETSIKELKHRIAICTMKDVVISSDQMVLRREAVVWTWAKIEHQHHLASFMSDTGYAIKELATRATHRIRVRTGLEIDYTAAAWIYEEFLKSPPRWYKVLGFVDDSDRIVMLECHLVESSELAKPSNSDLNPERMKVVL